MMRRTAISVPFLLLLFVAISRTQAPGPAARRWYKGNLHTHTLNSDGDSTPLDVATWYREHGYQFLVLSDHNFFTEPGGLNSVIGAKEKFLLIGGEEVTDSFEKKPVHVNAFNLAGLVEPQHGATLSATIQNNLDAIRKAGALPSLNHPSFRWGVTIDDMLAVRGLTHFEVYNGHPQVNNLGGGGEPSLEKMWDTLLTAGARLYGVAVDDAHHFKRIGRELSNPGRGWVSVRAEALTPEAIVRALDQGEFYASTGVTLRDVRITERDYALDIAPYDVEKTTTYFIGSGGKVLATSFDAAPRYRISGGEKYVRARVESSNGAVAWTMPVFLERATGSP
jgi:predicted metal-dependent phosphoesterase TrpH